MLILCVICDRHNKWRQRIEDYLLKHWNIVSESESEIIFKDILELSLGKCLAVHGGWCLISQAEIYPVTVCMPMKNNLPKNKLCD